MLVFTSADRSDQEEQSQDSVVLLYVVTMTEHQNNDEVTLRCSVTRYGECGHRVKWLLQVKYGDKVQTFSLQSSDWWLYIVVALVLVALLITIVAFITWRKMKGKEARKRDSVGQTSNPAVNSPETNPATADPEEGVSYASINYTKNTHKKAEIKNDADEGDAVTYSTLKASTNDPNSLYDTIY
ncbi:Transmembrane gamma-carboxyglutamic acid protein 3 [Dissostichus eleginoides]|uniref:Transmembrane gamma-carboxyglutamic acid protein 3 n=1 Tax=Dissostichus eleginoides TaxID=100907 RepID=A0AAD9BU64_DISEL|nr:Transmembrane gamma-carboxyglutamic acid protein 3 [Dissostichus eleginoides]